jgi:two-component system sensor histidine kinase UhpB
MSDLAAYLRNGIERERADLAREIHDELGGLLVSAKLELSLLERELGPASGSVQSRIVQLRQSLDSAVSFKRRIVDRLYPSLLVHVGLFATLRWYAEELREQIGCACTARVPEQELPLPPAAAIALYRIVQEAVGESLARDKKAAIELSASARKGTLELKIASTTHETAGSSSTAGTDAALLSMQSRMAYVGGSLTVESPAPSRVVISLRLSLDEAKTLAGA